MIEYEDHYRTGMGTESVGPLLRSLVRMVRPNRILEIGAGYTTPFLLEGLEKNEELFDDGSGCLNEEYAKNHKENYDPKFVIIDDNVLTYEESQNSTELEMKNLLKSKWQQIGKNKDLQLLKIVEKKSK